MSPVNRNASPFELRPYQRHAVDAIEAAWRGDRRPTGEGRVNRVATVAATGLGKTVVFSDLISRAHDRRERALVLVHREELADQAMRKLHSVVPAASIGLVKAERNEWDADVVVASVPTLGRSAKRREQIPADRFGIGIADECFPAGTLVGDVPIEYLRPGDSVPSWDERTGAFVSRRVVATMSRRPESMLKVEFDDGRIVHCTANHPFMTADGWTAAGKLSRGAQVLSLSHDSAASGDLHRVRLAGHLDRETEDRQLPSEWANVLLDRVPGLVGVSGPLGQDGPHEPETRLGQDAGAQPDGTAGSPREGVGVPSPDRARTEGARRERNAGTGSAEDAGRVPGLADRGGRTDQDRRAAVALQAGHRAPDDEGVRRGGWRFAPSAGPAGVGSSEGRLADYARVARVQVLEPGRDGTYGGVCSDGLVYNIEVESTHTYLVSGLVVHNCHHAAADTWQRTMHYFGAFDGRSNWAGFTATMARGDDRQLGETWSEVTAEYDISFGIRNKFLVPVSGKRIRVKNLQLDEVKRSRGDYQDNDLGEAMEDADAGNTIADAYEKHGGGRRAAMFSPTKSTARRFADDLNARGIPTEVVLGETTSDERRAIYERFRTGETKVISSCMVITEGWDAPWAEVAIMARPTTSNALYIQCIGRVLRPFPAGGKQSALVLDVVGASSKNKLVSLVELHELKDIAPYDQFPDGDDDPDGVVFGTADDGPGYIEGEIVATEIELFDTSDSMWLQTDGNLWFIPTKTAYFYLWPQRDGSFVLGRKVVNGPPRRHGESLEQGLTLEGGMAWAERYAVEEEGGRASISNRHASWRRRQPSEAMQKLARALQIPTDGQRQGELSDCITIAKASRSLPTPTVRA